MNKVKLVRIISLFFVLTFILSGLMGVQERTYAAQGIMLYTPYTGLSVTPGE